MTTGEHVGPYLIEAAIGEGGMGAVYRARDTRLDRTVALKVSKTDFSDRFEREARAIAALNHPNICTLHDVGPNYLVMELIEGTPLKGPLPVEKAVEYGGQILEALDAAHRKGFTHRDLKPANILVTKQGIKLLDFGLAKQNAPLEQTDATMTKALTGEGQIVGTLQYMSPEQLQGKPADARSDLFAFGCVLYELLSGKRAFEGQSTASVIAAILEREPAPLDLHPPLGRVIKTCLEKDPDRRFQNALDLKRALGWAMETTAAVSPSRWWPGMAAGLAAVALAAGWIFSRSLATPSSSATPPIPVRMSFEDVEISSIGRSFSRGLALSPDGRTLVFAQATRELWLREMETAVTRKLAGTAGGSQPFWSPDGRWVAYFSGGKLWRIAVSGNTQPIPVCETGFALGGAWLASGDGMLIGNLNGPIRRVSLADGSVTLVGALHPGETSQRWPQILPGGGYLYRSNWRGGFRIFAALLARPAERKQVVETPSRAIYAAGYLLFLKGATLVAQKFDAEKRALEGELITVTSPIRKFNGSGYIDVAASADLVVFGSSPMSQLTWRDRAGQVLGTLGKPGWLSSIELSPDGKTVAVTQDSNDTDSGDVWLAETERDVWTLFAKNASLPVWSPDGRAIVFNWRGEPRGLIRKEVGGTQGERRITTVANDTILSSWSADGKTLLYATSGNTDMFTVSAEEPAPRPIPFLQTPASEGNGQFSTHPVHRWVAYVSNESGPNEVFLRTFPQAGSKRQVSINGGSWVRWGPGGRELFYVARGTLMSVEVRLTRDTAELAPPRELFDLGGGAFDVTADGQRFLVDTSPPGSQRQPLRAILNWRSLQRASPDR